MSLAELFHNADGWLLDRIQEFDPRPAMHSLGFAAAAQLLVQVRRARGALSIAEAELEQHVAATMTPDMEGARVDERGRFQGVEVAGVGVLLRHAKGGRKGWNHDGVRGEVVSRMADDLPYAGAVTEEGERVPLAVVVHDVIAKYAESCGYQWKLTGLRALGIDPDDYSQWTPPADPKARWTVEVQ